MSEHLVGGSELARLLGSTPQSILKATKTGRLSTAKIENGVKFYDPEIARQEWEATKEIAAAQNRAAHMPPGKRGGRPRKEPGAVPGDAGDMSYSMRFAKARAEHEAVKAQERAFDLRIKAGKYIEKEQVERDGAELGAILNGFMDAFPDRHAAVLAAMDDRHSVFLYLQKEFNQLKIEIRDRCGFENAD